KNVLLANNCDGTFKDVTDRAGVGDTRWSTSAAFFDYDNDGRLDLFVCNYVDWDFSKHMFCGESKPGYRSYCHPNNYKGISNTLYRNNGDGTFADVTKRAGIASNEGKGLGVVAADINGDGWMDIFVANDAVRNFLFVNNGDGTFTESALVAEVAYGLTGKPQSGMGCDLGDVDGDGRVDLVVTNIELEPNNVWRNNGDSTFTDVTVKVGLAKVALLFSGFGVRFVDYDNDGDLDQVIANGHPLDNIHLFRDGVTWAERPFVHDNLGGTFADVSDERGEAMKKRYSGRGLAMGDYDNDGDSDFLLVQNGGPPVLLRNDGGNRNNWVGLQLVGAKSNRDATGARVTVKAGDLTMVRQIVGGASYTAAHDPRLIIGIGRRAKIDSIEIRWPSGVVDLIKDAMPGRYTTVKEGSAAKQ
ncbi:MAG TPA: CRTAC1 family protein, partial [Blastocatellia bacterium]|nr:CRTAC1 family protein [Blastocatellia bacterium]